MLISLRVLGDFRRFTMKKRLIYTILLSLVSCLILLSSCALFSNPIVGTWSDSIGNTLMLNDQGAYKATIISSGVTEGTYEVNLNTLVLKDSDGNFTYCKWDIRGSIMLLEIDEGITTNMLSLTYSGPQESE